MTVCVCVCGRRAAGLDYDGCTGRLARLSQPASLEPLVAHRKPVRGMLYTSSDGSVRRVVLYIYIYIYIYIYNVCVYIYI